MQNSVFFYVFFFFFRLYVRKSLFSLNCNLVVQGMSFVSQFAQLTDFLYLSSAFAITRERLLDFRITHIISCTLEAPSPNELEIKTTFLQIGDNPQSRLDEYFDKVSDEINDVVMQCGNVLVHCLGGVSRSSTICIAYLMKHKKMKLKEAHDFVKSKRRIIRPNIGFWEQLVNYERKLFGSNTVNLIETSTGLIPDIYSDQTKIML